jgi:predicted ATPase/class 3 adenylate cyclase
VAASGPDRAGSPLYICLFGPFEVCLHGHPLPRLRYQKSQWLLALLALRRGAEVERDWLAGLLWPESTERQALRNSLSDLRRGLGLEADRLRSPTRHSLALDLSGAEVDALAFDSALTQGNRPALERAVSLYRGPLLEGCAEEWAFQERQAREQAYLQALERLAEQALAGGEPGVAEGYLRRAVAVDPLREGAQRALMQTLAAGGNFAAALLTYRELRLRLHRELNAVPDPETKALCQQIRAEARCRAQAIPPPRSLPADAPAQRLLPSPLAAEGTITFLFTDIEGSTRLWEQYPEAMHGVLSRHDLLLRQAIESQGGQVFKTMGDEICAAFVTAPAALTAAVAAQRILQGEAWGETGPLRVRIALHTGAAEEREGDYVGPPLNRVARLLAVGYGGQVLLSQPTYELVRDALPDGMSLRDLGQHRLKDLVRPEHIFQLVSPDLPADFPPLQSLNLLPNNLPRQLTSFIGREREMAEVKEGLTATALLTLTGTGGCGKTRLALQAAADLVEAYPHGVWLVELAALADPNLVAQTVASVLGVREAPGRPLTETLVDALRPKQLLLVLDNCEHLVAACAALAGLLLRRCPQLQILATSREALGVAGERLFRVPSLSAPDPRQRVPVESLTQYEAVRLFIDRAVMSQPSFAVTNANAPAVAQICHRLDGIPLAIELAAARVKVLTAEQIMERLDDRFRLLTGGSRTALPRQQTLRALVDWSYNLLAEAERVLLRRLCVFAGGWTLEAAEAVCADEGLAAREVLDVLSRLMEKSLVVYEEQYAAARYRLLETVRQYGHDRLLETSESEAIRGRHRDYFLRFAEAVEPELYDTAQVDWLNRLETEHDNLRAALEWCRAEVQGAEAGLRLAGALYRFWIMRGYETEGRQWLQVMLARSDGVSPPTRARALLSAASLAWRQGDNAQALPMCEESLTLWRESGDLLQTAQTLCLLGSLVYRWQRNPQRAVALLEESLVLYQEAQGKPEWSLWQLAQLALRQADYDRVTVFCEQALVLLHGRGDRFAMSLQLCTLGLVAHYEGDDERARALLENGLALARELGDRGAAAHVLNGLGLLALNRREYRKAAELFEEGLALLRERGDQWWFSASLNGLALAALRQGDHARASAFYCESLGLLRPLRNQDLSIECLEGGASLALARDRAERAARLFGAAQVLRHDSNFRLPPSDPEGYDRDAAAARATLGEEAFAAAWAEGQAMTFDRALAYAAEEEAQPPSSTGD